MLFLLLTLSSSVLLRTLLGHGLGILSSPKDAQKGDGCIESRKLTYVGLIPLTEGGGIDLDNGALDKRVRPDELVVGGVVNL